MAQTQGRPDMVPSDSRVNEIINYFWNVLSCYTHVERLKFVVAIWRDRKELYLFIYDGQEIISKSVQRYA